MAKFLIKAKILFNMNEIAKSLNDIINIYGFGCEFSKEELVDNFENIDKILESFEKHDLIEKNQLSGKYYLTDIFTCNIFLSQHLKEESKESSAVMINKKYELTIKKENLVKFISSLKGFEENVKRLDVKSRSDEFNVHLEVSIDEEMIVKFEEKLEK